MLQEPHDSKDLSYLDSDYQGELRIGAMLVKYKWSAGLGHLFGSFVTRYFVLDLSNFTFGYYQSSKCESKGSSVISISVFFNFVIIPGYCISFAYPLS